jgi:hypothetical protein
MMKRQQISPLLGNNSSLKIVQAKFSSSFSYKNVQEKYKRLLNNFGYIHMHVYCIFPFLFYRLEEKRIACVDNF